MSYKTDKTAPAEVYINPNTMQVVGEGYPNAVRYIREDVVKETKTQHCHMDDMSFMSQ